MRLLLCKNYYKLTLAIAMLLAFGMPAGFAQITGPEQDCKNAIPVCQEIYVQDSVYRGFGQLDEINGDSSCLQNGENNTVWYVFTVATTGVLEFLIIPHGPDDYDFALYNITNKSCSDIYADRSLQVRCSYYASTSTTVIDTTGLRAGYVNTSEGSSGLPFLAPLNVTAGETFVLVVDNFSTIALGYTLDFTPSSAQIIDTVRPTVTAIDSLGCEGTTTFDITFSEPILCASLATDGSDFQIMGPGAVPVAGVVSTDCAGGTFTLSASITLSGPITASGAYGLILKNGTDGNTVQDNCGNTAPQDTFPLFVPDIVNAGFSFVKSTSCIADTVTFNNTSTGNITSYTWDFGDSSPASNQPNPVHVYSNIGAYTVTLIVSSAECSDTISRDVNASHSYDASFAYSPAEPCAGDPITFTDTSQTFATDYFWRVVFNGSTTELSIAQNPTFTFGGAGIYTVTFTIRDANLGCVDSTTLDVLVHETTIAAFTAVDPCSDVPVSFTDISAGSPASWLWTTPTSTSTDPNPSFTFPDPGTFPVTLAVVDSFCSGDDTTMNVVVLPSPSFSLGQDEILCRSEELPLSAFPGADSYLWSTGETTANIVYDSLAGFVWATAFLDGCAYTDSLLIIEQTVDCSFAMVPSGFSPNADGKNDVLNVLTKRVSTYEMIIYNRWGQEVYRGTNADTGWDGSFKDEPQDIGVFSYVLNWRNLSEQPFVESGSITLVR